MGTFALGAVTATLSPLCSGREFSAQHKRTPRKLGTPPRRVPTPGLEPRSSNRMKAGGSDLLKMRPQAVGVCNEDVRPVRGREMVSGYRQCSERKLCKTGLSSRIRSTTMPCRETTAGILVARRSLCTPSNPGRSALVAAIAACREATPSAARSVQRPLEASTRRRGRRIGRRMLTHRAVAPSARPPPAITSARASASAFAQPRGSKSLSIAIACWWFVKGRGNHGLHGRCLRVAGT